MSESDGVSACTSIARAAEQMELTTLYRRPAPHCACPFPCTIFVVLFCPPQKFRVRNKAGQSQEVEESGQSNQTMATGMTDDDIQQIVDGYKGRARLDSLEDGSHSSTKQLENR